MAFIENVALKQMRAGQPALGMQVRLGRTGEIAASAAATGHNWIMLDMQHSGIDVATVVEISLASYGFGVTPVVRISDVNSPDLVRLLDAGVMGMVLPDTRNATEARRFVGRCRFPPLGSRSVTTGYVVLGYEPLHIEEAADKLNSETLVVCMVESLEGMSNLEEIAGVEGVDVLHMGCNDLLMDMGLPGQFGCPAIQEHIARFLDVCKRHGKFAGFGGDRDASRQRNFVESGGLFLTIDSDLGFLRAEGLRRSQALRLPHAVEAAAARGAA